MIVSDYDTGYDDGAAFVARFVLDQLEARIRSGSADGRLAVTDARSDLAASLKRWSRLEVIPPAPVPVVPVVDHHAIGHAEGYEKGVQDGLAEAHRESDPHRTGYDEAMADVVRYFDQKVRFGQGGDKMANLALVNSLKAEFGLDTVITVP